MAQAIQMAQAISAPQHMGDLILPWPPGHSEMRTSAPVSVISTLSTSAVSQAPQEVLTDISHEGQL